jgi:predicted transglutaminase-like cysteine proteinase
MNTTIKLYVISAATLMVAFSSFFLATASASTLYNTQVSSTLYSASLSTRSVRDVARSTTIGGVVNLFGIAGHRIVRALGSLDVAALAQSLEPAPAGWTRETSAAVKPAVRPSVSPTAADSAVFGSVAIPFKRLAALKRLAPSLSEMNDGTAIACGAGTCSAATVAIKAAFTTTTRASIRDKMNAVNATVNHTIRYRRDIDTYKVADYWATPAETLARQQGDCEDFAILKMAVLHAEGIDLKDMAVVVLYDQKRHFYHAILSVAVDGNRFILDNMRDEVLPDTRLPDYLPLYSIAGGKGYIHGSRVGGSQVASVMPIEKVAPGEGVAF